MSWFRNASLTVRTMTVTSTLAAVSLLGSLLLPVSGFANPLLVLAVFLLVQTVISGVTSHVEKDTLADSRRALVGAVLQVVTAFVVLGDAVMLSASDYQSIAHASETNQMAPVPLGTCFALLFWSLIAVALLSWSVISGEQAINCMRGHRKSVSKGFRKHLRKQRGRVRVQDIKQRLKMRKHQTALLLDLENFFKGSDHSDEDNSSKN